jgi:hypothetical protein
VCATAYSSRAEGREYTGPEREEVTGGWMKQPSDDGKNESTYVALVWKYEGKRLL